MMLYELEKHDVWVNVAQILYIEKGMFSVKICMPDRREFSITETDFKEIQQLLEK